MKKKCSRCSKIRINQGIFCRSCYVYYILATVKDQEERRRRLKEKSPNSSL